MEYIRGFVFPKDFSLYSGDSILVALSGGADSALLVTLLSQYGKENGVSIYAAHVNHMIRGADADRDERFCRELCKRLDVKLFTRRVDVPSLSEAQGRSLETVARDVRYKFFGDLMQEHGIRVLTTAHNADDSFETVLFNISRGSGLRGAGGISPERVFHCGVLIRPLINCKKQDIIEFCQTNGIEYVTDATNTDTAYSRNRIRARVIPELCQVSSGAVEAAARFADTIRQDADFIDGYAQNVFDTLSNSGFKASDISSYHPSISKRVIMLMLKNTLGDVPETDTQLSACHVEAILELCLKAREHSSLSLPHGIFAAIKGGKLVISRKTDEPTSLAQRPDVIELAEGENDFGSMTVLLSFSKPSGAQITKDTPDSANVYNCGTYLSLEFDKIEGSLCARVRRPGDTLRRGGISKRVKDIMSEAKVPLELRDVIPVIEAGGAILGIPGIRGAVREGFFPNKSTKSRIVYVSAYPKTKRTKKERH